MKTSERGIQLIKFFESLHDGDLSKIGLQPKLCPADVVTIGYGHAVKDKNGNFLNQLLCIHQYFGIVWRLHLERYQNQKQRIYLILVMLT